MQFKKKKQNTPFNSIDKPLKHDKWKNKKMQKGAYCIIPFSWNSKKYKFGAGRWGLIGKEYMEQMEMFYILIMYTFNKTNGSILLHVNYTLIKLIFYIAEYILTLVM